MSDASPVFVHRLQARFRDCDPVGHVNNAVYFTYFEQARIAWWRQVGGEARFPGANTVIVHAECDYKAPVFPQDELDIRVYLDGIGRSSITLSYEILQVAHGAVVATGRTTNVTVDATSRTTIPVPEAARALLTRQ